MSAPLPSPSSARVVGYDLARSFAIGTMMLINFQVFLLAPPSGSASEVLGRYLAHVPSGRSSATFVVLAGVGIAQMCKAAEASGRWWPTIRTLLLRALFLLVAGNALRTVWSIDILHFYAFYLACAALFFVRLPRWALLPMAALVALSAVGVEMAIPGIGDAELPYWTPEGMALDVAVSGIHPLLPWLSFVLVGLFVGRIPLTHRATRRRTLAIAGSVVLLTELASVALTSLAVRAELSHVSMMATDWSPSPMYVLAASATSTFFIALAFELTERFGETRLVRALIAAGQLSLSLYVWHALVGVGVPRWLLGAAEQIPLGPLVAYWAAFFVLSVILAALWRARFRRGPLEAIMRWLVRAPASEGTSSELPSASERAPHRATWGVLAMGALVVLAIRVVGATPPSLGCAPVPRIEALPASTSGQLTLSCPHAHFALVLEHEARLTLSTRSGMDAYIEVRRDGAIVAEDDDGGPGLDALAIAKLSPGEHDVVVRPYGGSTGPFLLRIEELR